ncbi:hypothetical protein [Streptomyces alkaliterrae]|uniref:Uncharacterized protein n=1 Tax=Streptomyces alkaliterrae TaxID=2213162 RepID=A0A5P0YP19_9ACTN|nr:hypothetical protein [Streptomyces alkaliterrae]MBB1261732.1 hypothetical protein [Streptomyces alkaliterrae]MQS02103.1 hypothetical protein [Streptomyces alkaliterrae]
MITPRRVSTVLVSAGVITALGLGLPSSAAATPTTIVSRSGVGDVTVHCPEHHRVTGGGVDVEHDDEISIFRSRPTQDGRGWEGAAWGEVDDKDAEGGNGKGKGGKGKGGNAKGKGGKGKGEGGREEAEEPRALPLTVYAVCAPGS